MSKSRIKRATPEDISAFAEAIYPGFGELSLATFNEKIFINDATKGLTDLRAKLGIAVAALTEIADSGTWENRRFYIAREALAKITEGEGEAEGDK